MSSSSFILMKFENKILFLHIRIHFNEIYVIIIQHRIYRFNNKYKGVRLLSLSWCIRELVRAIGTSKPQLSRFFFPTQTSTFWFIINIKCNNWIRKLVNVPNLLGTQFFILRSLSMSINSLLPSIITFLAFFSLLLYKINVSVF